MENIKNILDRTQSIAVVGVSNKPERPSYLVAKYLLENSNFKIYFVNPVIDELFGRKVYKSLEDLHREVGHIDLVDVFRKIEDMETVLKEAIKIKANYFWMQLGLASDQLALEGEAEGLSVIQDKCIKIELEKLAK